MTANKAFGSGKRVCAALLVGTILGGLAAPAQAQAQAQQTPAATAPTVAAPAAPAAALPGSGVIRSIAVTGNQRLEAETVVSYMK
ncbi:MAG TPA: hypothetical protein VFF61_06640, partial [Microvirga sp.]|nr:hypothetical protein [Microvirga sp.]